MIIERKFGLETRFFSSPGFSIIDPNSNNNSNRYNYIRYIKKKTPWIKWDKATSPISNGGLGIGTLKYSNQAMLCKWWWRFHNENSALWHKEIRSIHGIDGGLNEFSSIKSKTGPWFRIAKLK